MDKKIVAGTMIALFGLGAGLFVSTVAVGAALLVVFSASRGEPTLPMGLDTGRSDGEGFEEVTMRASQPEVRNASASTPTLPPPEPAAQRSAHRDDDAVIVNGQRLSPQDLQMIELAYGMRLPPGSYTYDANGLRPAAPVAGSTGPSSQTKGTSGSPRVRRSANGRVIVEYTCDIAGMDSQMSIEYEQLPNGFISETSSTIGYSWDGQSYRTYMGGEVRNANAYYTFTADGPLGEAYGDAVDMLNNQRFRIRLEHTTQGVFLVPNPFEGNHGIEGSARYFCRF